MASILELLLLFSCLLAVVYATTLVTWIFARRSYYRNLTCSLSSFRIPSNAGRNSRWRSARYRNTKQETPRVCWVAMADGGVLIRDVFAHILFFPMTFGAAFIPRDRLANDRPYLLDWYSQLFDNSEWVETDVKGFGFSIIVRKEMAKLDQGRKAGGETKTEGE